MRLLGAWGWIAIQALVKLQCIGGTLFPRLHPDRCFIVFREYRKQDFWFTWQSRPYVINKKYLQDTVRIARCWSSRLSLLTSALAKAGISKEERKYACKGIARYSVPRHAINPRDIFAAKFVWVWVLSGLTLERQEGPFVSHSSVERTWKCWSCLKSI